MLRDPYAVAWRLWAVLSLVAIILADGLLVAGPRKSPPECKSFAEIVQRAADARDAGISRHDFLAYTRKRFHRMGLNLVLRALFLREMAAVFRSVLSADRIEQDA